MNDNDSIAHLHKDYVSVTEEVLMFPASLSNEDWAFMYLYVFVLRLLFGMDYWVNNSEKLNRRSEARHANK